MIPGHLYTHSNLATNNTVVVENKFECNLQLDVGQCGVGRVVHTHGVHDRGYQPASCSQIHVQSWTFNVAVANCSASLNWYAKTAYYIQSSFIRWSVIRAHWWTNSVNDLELCEIFVCIAFLSPPWLPENLSNNKDIYLFIVYQRLSFSSCTLLLH